MIYVFSYDINIANLVKKISLKCMIALTGLFAPLQPSPKGEGVERGLRKVNKAGHNMRGRMSSFKRKRKRTGGGGRGGGGGVESAGRSTMMLYEDDL